MIMKRVELDKLKHFLMGISIGVALELALWKMLPEQLKLVTVLTLLGVMVMNYGFEVYSKIKNKGDYEVLDAVAGTVGGAIGMAAILIAQYS